MFSRQAMAQRLRLITKILLLSGPDGAPRAPERGAVPGLVALLLELLTVAELKVWLCQREETSEILDQLPPSGSADQVMFEAVMALKRRRLVDRQLFLSLLAVRRRHRRPIQDVARLWGVLL